MEIIINEEERKDLEKGIRRALNENYILKASGETDEDCQVHAILTQFENFLRLRYR